MKKTLLLLLTVLLPIAASAYDAYVGGIYYNLSGSQATVTSGTNKYTGSVSIPRRSLMTGRPTR